jgi:hypothetical protein
MPESPDFSLYEIPARIADLGFRVAVPSDWNSLEIPADEVDFSAPDTFFPLFVAAAPWAAVILTVAARPGFENGTIQDWSLFLLDSQGIRPTAFGPAQIGNLQGLAGVGRQEQDGTWLECRFAFLEDGGRLVHLGLMAPEAISAPLAPVWQTALESFALQSPQGQNVPVGPGAGICPEPEPVPVAAPPVTETAASTAVPDAPPPSEPESPAEAAFTDSALGYYAKSADLSTLDPEHPINARLRDQGVGLVPNLLEADLEGRTAKLGAGAIAAVIRVALGWHVIDDGRRTLVLDPAGVIQISLNVIATEGRGIDQVLDEIQSEAEQSYPHPQFLRLEDGGISALSIRGIEVDGEPVEQVHMLTAWWKDSAVLRARVTSNRESMRFAANYADLILKSVEYGQVAEETVAPETESDVEADTTSGWPEWARRAEQLEREDRLKEAEQEIHDNIPSLHFAIATAELYRRRWLRLRESDPAKAADARKLAADWAYRYASYATSGGEGVALSYERDQFLRQLGPEPLE